MVEILDACLNGLIQLFTWKAFALQLLGIAIGFMVGILPGLGGPVTLALMLPFIYPMSPVEAFSFLLGMAAVTATTGDITSILFGVPGEPVTASIVVDGHPMAKKGEAGRALGAALTSSLIGAVFGALCLAICIPIVRPLVLSVGSPQYFMFTMLGIAFLASLTGDSVVKGLTAACLGLMFALIGLDPISGTERYTFEHLYLWDGIGLVPATLGLFAIPEIVDMARAGKSISKLSVGKIGGVLQGVKDTFKHWALVIRCSALGTYIGIIPGMGGSLSQWVSYAHAVQSSPDKSRFGKGAVEGVLAPGAANHSTLGGAMIPTVAFGVPGSVTTAILLGAFLIQGLVPGPPMLQPESQGGHLSLTFSFVWIIVVSNIITTIICFMFLSRIAKITQVRTTLVIPFVLLLVYIGAFAENNAFGDVIVMLLFGILGWIMVQLDWPRPPLILGLVLGKLAEQNLFLSIDGYGLEWLGFPSVIVLMALIVLGTAYPFYQRWTESRSKPAYKQIAEASELQATEAVPVTIWFAIFSASLVALFGWALWQSWGWDFRPGLFPWVVCFIGLPLAFLQLNIDIVGAIRGLRDEKAKADDAEGRRVRRETYRICSWLLAYFLAIWLLGFSAAIAVMTFLYLVLAKERLLVAVGVTLVAWVVFYGLFIYGLNVPFPPGAVFEWLGLGVPRAST